MKVGRSRGGNGRSQGCTYRSKFPFPHPPQDVPLSAESVREEYCGKEEARSYFLGHNEFGAGR